MPLELYHTPGSPPCRAVRLTAAAVGVTLNLTRINMKANEQLKPEFVAINPVHCIPTLVDGDFVLWESRAICNYLASHYGQDDSLYPNDPKTRARVDRLLYFDLGTLFPRYQDYVQPFLRRDEKLDPERLAKVMEALTWLDADLAGHRWAVHNHITVADHTLVATVSTMEATGLFHLAKFDNITAWLARCKAEMPGYSEANGPGAEHYGASVRAKMEKMGLTGHG